MPSRPRGKPRSGGSKKAHSKPARTASPARPIAKAVSKPKPAPARSAKPSKPSMPPKSSAPPTGEPAAPPRAGDSRRHVLSLSFLRDGDEFMARLESDSGQITELKHRTLDQLLTLVASELEDLLE